MPYSIIWHHPSDAIWHHWTWATLVQAMACCLFHTKPLLKSMLTYCQLDPDDQINFSEISIEIQTFSFKKLDSEISSATWQLVVFLHLNLNVISHEGCTSLTHTHWYGALSAIYNNKVEPPESVFKLKSCQKWFTYNLHFVWWILLKFCTDQITVTTVLCTKFQD